MSSSIRDRAQDMERRCRHAFASACLMLLAACDQAPPTWDKLIASKITEQYPSYTVEQPAPGKLLVHRPGQTDFPVEIVPITVHCNRGPRDCNYIVEQLLIELRGAGK